MNILLLLLPLGLVLMAIAIGFFIWTVKSGHYEDLDSPARRILIDDDQDRVPPSARSGDAGTEAGQGKPAGTNNRKGE